MSHGNLNDWLALGDALGIGAVGAMQAPNNAWAGPFPDGQFGDVVSGYGHVGAGPSPEEAIGRLDQDVKLLAQEADAQQPAMFDGAAVAGRPAPTTRWGWPDYGSVSGYGEPDHMAATARHAYPLANVGAVTLAQPGIGKNVPGASPRYKAWKDLRAQYGLFATEWEAWKRTVQLDPVSYRVLGISDTQAGELSRLQDRFNCWRKKWIAFGVKTGTAEQERFAGGSWFDRNWGKVALIGAIVVAPFAIAAVLQAKAAGAAAAVL